MPRSSGISADGAVAAAVEEEEVETSAAEAEAEAEAPLLTPPWDALGCCAASCCC